MQIEESKIKAALDAAHKEAGENAYFGNGFKMGIEFALKELKRKKLSHFEIMNQMVEQDKDIRCFDNIHDLKQVKSEGGLVAFGVDLETFKLIMKDNEPTNFGKPKKYAVFTLVVNVAESNEIKNS